MQNNTPKPVQVRQPSPEEMQLLVEFNREFLKLHYEPEHEEGELCWCKPLLSVKNGVYHIDHNEQRKALRALFVEFITKYSSIVAAQEGKL